MSEAESSSRKQHGHYHPLTRVIDEIHEIFTGLGFAVAYGNHIISDEENFTVLNLPADHPARDMHDTFWIDDSGGDVMRTHISSMQVPYMREQSTPLAMVSSGRVYRYEATDATHEAAYHYTEGLMIGEDITLVHLRGVLQEFFDQFFGEETELRMRPGYFPFVEPGVEVEMKWKNRRGEDEWLELLGAGMVHPTVLKNGQIDPDVYQGFAFGLGVNRLAMLKYGIPDVRLFYDGDLRFVNQF